MRYSHIVLIVLSSLFAITNSFATENDTPSKRFTAMRVFDMEYATDPQISPDGKQIAYVRHSMDRMNDKDKGQIWLINIDDGIHLPLIDGGAVSHSPRWSPDGKSLLFVTATQGIPELRLYYFQSDRSIGLAQFISAPSRAIWSPDGKHIAFNMFVKGKKPSFSTPVTKPEGAKWNDAVKVFDDLSFRFDGVGYLPEGTTQVFTLPVEGGSPRQLTHGNVNLKTSTWLDNDTVLVTGNES